MSILCSLGKHEASVKAIWNNGFYFSRCGRCEADLIRKRNGWRPVPKGYRVVWKERRPIDIDWSTWSPCDNHGDGEVAFLKANWS